MPQKRSNPEPPQVMTWGKATPALIVCGVFDLLRIFFEFFWFFGPAAAAVYCTTKVNDTLSTWTLGLLGTKTAALACSAGAAIAGTAGIEITGPFGIVMAIAVGLFGWLVIGLWLFITNPHIFKANTGNALWFLGSLLLSETPILGSVPALTGTTWRMYHAQIKKDKEELKKYETQRAATQLRERQQAAAIMQEEAAILEPADVY